MGAGLRIITLPLQGKGGQVRNDLGQLLEQQIHGLPHKNQLGVVSDEAAGRAVVNDPCSRWGHGSERMDVLLFPALVGDYDGPWHGTELTAMTSYTSTLVSTKQVK